MNEYIPGTCNIGAAEIKKRKVGTIISAILMVGVLILFQLMSIDGIWRFFLFFPATLFAINFLQVYFKFCVAFGLKGVFNFGDLGKSNSRVSSEHRRKDRKKSILMIGSGLLFGLAVSILYYFLPIL